MKKTEYGIETFKAWTEEAVWAAQQWRGESLRDCEMYDGEQWSEQDLYDADEAGVAPLTINRTFPVCNLILGLQAQNQFDVACRARTKDDSEINEVLSESIKFVFDQNAGEDVLSSAFKDAIIPGVGFVRVDINPDPRREPVRVAHVDWYDLEFDPFAGPDFRTDRCRYVVERRWIDLDDLVAMFPRKKKEIEAQFDSLQESHEGGLASLTLDVGLFAEQQRSSAFATSWGEESGRKRVRPAQMWYHKRELGIFARMNDGRVVEIPKSMDASDAYGLIVAAEEVVKSWVRKMYVVTFLGDLELDHRPSPFPHDEFPFVPFVAYQDRFKFPFGVPRQIRGQDIEVNKRRSMALALLRSRRVVAEEGVVSGDAAHDTLYEEAQKLNGYLRVNDGGLDKIQIVEQSDLAPSQTALLDQSEREIREISGAIEEMSRGPRGAVEQSNIIPTMVTPIMRNYRSSLRKVGELTQSLIQGVWTGEKVLRVTDRMSGADRFVVLNERIEGPNGIELRNDITQGRYDVVVSDTPASATVRERNMELIIEWTKKSPPEIIPQLAMMAMEMSNLPNKDQMMARLKPLMGIDPRDEDMSPEERKQKVIEQLEAQRAQEAEAAELERRRAEVELEEIRADTEHTLAQARVEEAKAQNHIGRMEIEAFKVGSEVERKKAELELKMQQAQAQEEREAREQRASVMGRQEGGPVRSDESKKDAKPPRKSGRERRQKRKEAREARG